MKLYNKVTIACLVTMTLAACSKSRLIEDSSAVITADLLFTSKAGFENALNGLSNEVRRYRSGETYGDINHIMSMQAVIGVDNAAGNYRDGWIDIFNKWGSFNNAAEQGHFAKVFGWLYETINAANTIIGRAERPGISWTDADKNRIVAEARCVRAWCYRHLTYLWGDVPLTLEESSGSTIKTDWTRTPVAEVRKAMEADWLFAEQYLPVTASSDARLIQGIASHFLAELYLSTGEYTKAKTEALKVINTSAYKLITQRYGVNRTNAGTPFTDMFLDGNSRRSQGNTEALWVIQNELNVNGGEGDNLMRRYWVNRYYSFTLGGKSPFVVTAAFGGRGLGRLAPTRFALNLYGATDDRGSDFAWRFYYTINNPTGIPAGTNPRTGQAYKLNDTIFLDKTGNEKESNANWPSTRKWDYASPIDPNVDRQYNDQVFLRLGETYLLLAEANLRLNDPQGAADAINPLRDRAKATPVTAAQMTMDFILDERSRELFSEEDRRYVLLRTGKWLERVKLYNKLAGPVAVARDTLFPIPQSVRDANLTLTFPQNPGYQ